jgi:enoyl-CoA hydratase/carnithine racemase
LKSSIANQGSSASTKVSLEINEPIGYISLNSPKDLNALSEQFFEEIASALWKCQKNDKIRVIVLRSKVPKIFCAGVNIKEEFAHDYNSYPKNELFGWI